MIAKMAVALTAKSSELALDRWRLMGIILGILGIVDATYLTWSKLADVAQFCGGLGSCSTVLHSEFSVLFGMPISILGAAAYLALLVLLLSETRVALLREWGAILAFGIALGGATYLSLPDLAAVWRHWSTLPLLSAFGGNNDRDFHDYSHSFAEIVCGKP